MAFTFIGYGRSHVDITSDDNCRLRFKVVRDENGVSDVVCATRDADEAWLESHEALVEDAARFASLCARDFGLI